jgi:hypothetical protein
MSGKANNEKRNASGKENLSPMPAGFTHYRPLPMMGWWFWFAVASYLLSLVFQTFKAFTLDTTLENTGWMMLAGLGLFLVMGYLSFDSYGKERRQGKIYHPVRLFEWVYVSIFGNDLEKGVVS